MGDLGTTTTNVQNTVQPKQSQAIKIDADGRYLLLMAEAIPIAEEQRISDLLETWWRSDAKFLVVNNPNVRFERVEK